MPPFLAAKQGVALLAAAGSAPQRSLHGGRMSRHWPSQTPLAATLCLAICALAACGHPQSCQFGCNDKTDPPKVYPSNVAARVEPALKGHFVTTPLVYHQSFGEAVSVLGDCPV